MILIPSVSPEKTSIKFVFTHFNTENDAGIHSKIYIFVLGLLMSQYSMAGYDASAHLVRGSFHFLNFQYAYYVLVTRNK